MDFPDMGPTNQLHALNPLILNYVNPKHNHTIPFRVI